MNGFNGFDNLCNLLTKEKISCYSLLKNNPSNLSNPMLKTINELRNKFNIGLNGFNGFDNLCNLCNLLTKEKISCYSLLKK